MKIFAYALREYDEKPYLEKICSQLGIEYEYTSDYPSLENIHLAKGADAISIITNPCGKEMLDALKANGIKAVSTRSIGYDHIDTDYAQSIGIKVCNVSYSPNSVANYTIMMMLMACRKIDYIMKKCALQDFSLRGNQGKEISLCTVGVVGTGRIGEELVKHLSGFGCKILAYDIFQKDEVKKYAQYVSLEELYAQSDIVTLHVPGLPENHHMINDITLSLMKDGVILVNAARGLLVDTDALVRALESGKVGFAALDTFENERGLFYLDFKDKLLQNRDFHLLSGMPNVMLSPHMAFYTDQAVSDMVGNSIRGIQSALKGEESPFVVV
ncbi:MAG: D-isomer specific 2-hydroxyacid dehydrogenase family protein [Treponema sp.]|nr:D-isomer specific 2-hydroxyacid dehydrogenase family protein [Treponema sp.]